MKTFRLFSILCLVITCLAFSAIALAQPHDFGGATVTFTWPGEGFMNDPRNLAHIEKIEALFNVNLEMVDLNAHGGMESPAITQMIEDLMSGETSIDLYMVNIRDIIGLVREGLIQPLDEPLKQIQYFENLPSMYRNWDFIKLHGKTWAVDREAVASNVEGVIFNKTLFEREDLPNPYELVESGDWTWDVFRDIMIRATRDTNGDGEVDQFGFGTRSETFFLVSWAATNNAYPTRTVDGREIFAYNEPEAIEAFQFWGDLVAQGVVQIGGFNNFRNGNIAMTRGPLWAGTGTWHGITTMTDDWGMVPLPKGPNSDDYVAPMAGTWVLVVPVTNTNPAATLDLYAALHNKSAKYADVEAINEDVWYSTYTINARDRETNQYLRWLVEDMTFINHFNILESAGIGSRLMDILHGRQNAASAMAEIAPVVQSLIDETFAQ